MQRLCATLFATTALAVATPAIAATSVCDNALIKGDMDADGQMTRQEIEAHRDAVFQHLDSDGDGEISRQEFVDCAGQAQQAAKEAAVKAEESGDARPGKWEQLETDKTGVSGREFAEKAGQAWDGKDTEAQQALSGSSGHDSAESFAKASADRFRMLDTDGDGIISQDEYERPATEVEWSEDTLNARFDVKDADNSGGISPQEFRAAGTWAPAPGQTSGTEDASATQSDSSDGTASGDGQTIPVFYYYIELL